jgi:3-oxoadipate CoA-transferase, beta subunit
VSADGRLSRPEVAARAARDVADGWYVNVGIGFPTLVPDALDPRSEVVLQSENGVLGVTPLAPGEQADPELIDAGTRPVALLPGGAFFACDQSFMMLRGGHVDVALLGALQVSRAGDLASWTTGRTGVAPAVGGAMDIAAGTPRIWVLMEHCTKGGEPRLVERCTLPLTAAGVVERVYTDLAVIDVEAEGFVVRESVAGLEPGELAERTGADLVFAEDWRPLEAVAGSGAR